MRWILQLGLMMLMLLGVGNRAWGRASASPAPVEWDCSPSRTFDRGVDAPPRRLASGEAAAWGLDVELAGTGPLDSTPTTAGPVVVTFHGTAFLMCPGAPPPVIGSFRATTPAWMAVGPNVYAYVKQNPWTGWDPDGLKTRQEWQGVLDKNHKRNEQISKRQDELKPSVLGRDRTKAEQSEYNKITGEKLKNFVECREARGAIEDLESSAKAVSFVTGEATDKVLGYLDNEGGLSKQVFDDGLALSKTGKAAELVAMYYGGRILGGVLDKICGRIAMSSIGVTFAENSAQRACWLGKDGLQAAQAAGHQTMQASNAALAAAKAGDLSLLRAESEAWVRGASGEIPVFVGKAAQAGKGGDIYWKTEASVLLDKVNKVEATIKYNFLK